MSPGLGSLWPGLVGRAYVRASEIFYNVSPMYLNSVIVTNDCNKRTLGVYLYHG